MEAVTLVVVLVLAALMGVTIGSYQGQSVSQMFQTAQANHDYTVDSSVFDVTAQDYINNPAWQNQYITGNDIQQANQRVQSGDIYWWMQNGFGSALYDAFDDSWSASVDSRTIDVYDSEGTHIGSTYIIGIVQSQIRYVDHVTVLPALIKPTGGRGWLLFESISADGNYYHTDFDGLSRDKAPVHTGGVGIANFAYSSRWTNQSETADSCYFTRSDTADYFHVWCGVDQCTSPYYFRSPVVGDSRLDEDEFEPIGEATLPDGTTVPVRPDGSVVLPDGTVVTPSSDGTYPISINLTFDRDYWARVAQELADAENAKNPAIENATEKELLDSIRDTNADTLKWLKGGFWDKLREFFTFDFDGITELDVPNPFSYLRELIEKMLAQWGVSGIG